MENISPKVLFLDIGGVLLTNGWGHESRQKAATEFGFDYERMNALHEIAFDVYEQGAVSLDYYLDTILFYEPRSFAKETFVQFMLSQSQLLPHTLDWLLQWKKTKPGLRIFSINNEPKELQEYRVKTFDLKRLYDGFICSCDVGLRKPDPRIYRLAMAVAAVEPDECIYIDDREVLVRAGSRQGMEAKTHKSFEETKDFLLGAF
ncbi:HAD family hydrolase [Flavisolibacter ginsenosidimutans]|uniref:HAD-IA family hydrolase n=1 Tax=Flavisolibacter ginsenosidimutans TaxID=661481 RepID=A0A5B8UHG8_9BACT|nr:HAD-IA family hydrolase [Flavisolibacter ginsenosidimutans]QEC56091.1 HAD-IA family hydrolase [Flavisolibacter ginsenosidimutans]